MSDNDNKKGLGGKAKDAATEASVAATQKAVASLSAAFNEYLDRVKAAQLPHTKLLDSVNKIRDANEKLVKAGGTFYSNFAPGGEYNRSMQEIIRLSQDFFGNANAGVAAMEGLALGMKSFVGVSSEMQRDIAKTTMYMGELGFNIDAVARALDNQAMAFGTSEKDLQKYASTMSKLSNTLFIEPTKLMENFDFAQTNFAYNAEQTLDVFVRLQEQSRKSGVEFGTLASRFGEGMDSFESVSSTAGRLNAILGSSVFNPMQLLNMDEAQRAAAIRRGIQDSPMLGGKDINQLSKFELKSVADTLNMSVLETRKFLTNQGDVRKEFQDTLDKRMGDQGVEGLTNLQSTNNELARMQDTIRNLRTDMENFYIDGAKKAAAEFDEEVKKLGDRVGATNVNPQDHYTIFRLAEKKRFGLVTKEQIEGLEPGDLTLMADFRDNSAMSPRAINPGIAGSRTRHTTPGAATHATTGLLTGRPGYTELGMNLLDFGIPGQYFDYDPNWLQKGKDLLNPPTTPSPPANPVTPGGGGGNSPSPIIGGEGSSLMIAVEKALTAVFESIFGDKEFIDGITRKAAAAVPSDNTLPGG